MNEIEIVGLFDDVLGMIYSAKQKYWQESGHGGNEQEREMINDQLKLH